MASEGKVSNVTENEEKILKILSDLANSLEETALNIKHHISELIGINEKPTWNPNNINWEQAQGSSGSYKRSEDVNSLDFKALLKDLNVHQGKLGKTATSIGHFKTEQPSDARNKNSLR